MPNRLTDAGVDFETAIGDLAGYYPDPVVIVADTPASRAQRQRLLAEWAQDLAERQAANSEGMACDDSQSAASNAALLKQVNAAIEEVKGQHDPVLSSTPLLWRRPKVLTK